MSIPPSLKGMNVILFMTDQERAIQHFPEGWEQANLPGMTRLKKNGLSFERAFCNACMCSPSRATLMTGFFPAQHGVKYTLEDDMPSPDYPQQVLLPRFANLATVMQSAGYSTPYKGKFHLTKPANPDNIYVPSDLARYGFERWNPTDAGANQDPAVYGGGDANHDSRYMHDCRIMEAGDEGVLAYLRQYAANTGTDQPPFFLVVSLVNPHDVLGYPSSAGALANGYDPSWLEGDIDLPLTVNEDLSTKPAVQQQFLTLTNLGLGKFKSADEQRRYINFYGNLMKSSDGYLVRMLNLLDQLGMTDNTLIIRTADHGEMGMAHGGQRQKNFNFYEESARVPLVYSNPNLYPAPIKTDTLVSHVDFLPTLASLFDAPAYARDEWQGIDYSSYLLNPASAPPSQPYVVFTYDDYQSGQKQGPYPHPNNHIVSIREQRYKLAMYYTPGRPGNKPEWEMYDTLADEPEARNIAYPGAKRTPTEEQELARLQQTLMQVMNTRLQPIEKTPTEVVAAAAMA